MEETLVLIKPDAVERNLIGAILQEYERNGLAIKEMKMLQADEETAKAHYDELKERDFFGELIEYITRSPLVALILEGEDAIAKTREINGKTNPKEAAANTIRAVYGIDGSENSVHASDSEESVKREKAIWFA